MDVQNDGGSTRNDRKSSGNGLLDDPEQEEIRHRVLVIGKFRVRSDLARDSRFRLKRTLLKGDGTITVLNEAGSKKEVQYRLVPLIVVGCRGHWGYYGGKWVLWFFVWGGGECSVEFFEGIHRDLGGPGTGGGIQQVYFVVKRTLTHVPRKKVGLFINAAWNTRPSMGIESGVLANSRNKA